MIPTTQYADSGGVEIAYKILGDGPRDIVVSMPGPSHLDMLWELPEWIDVLEQLSRLGRTIAFDKRGSGLSDRRLDGITHEDRCRDLVAVMDAAGSSTAALFGMVDSARTALMTAALYPQRVSAVIAVDVLAVGHRDADHPFGWNRTMLRMAQEAIAHGAWGRGVLLRALNPHIKFTDQQVARYARFESLAATPKAAARFFSVDADLDLRPYLSLIQVPVLLLHSEGSPMVPAEGVRWLADRLPHATLKPVHTSFPGLAGTPFQDLAEEIEEFLVGTRGAAENRQVATLLFTDVVGSTTRAAADGDLSWRHLLSTHREAARRACTRFDGTEVSTAGDGFLASFALPSAALRCARQVVSDSIELGIQVRAGVHTGEVAILAGGDLAGIAVHIAARVAALAQPSEILMTDTVRTLVTGTGFAIEPAGEHKLKGVPGDWPISRLVPATEAP
ncbi:adenylate/guanylate cyclase domain-containing protein [Ornithinimicrobium cerasi]|uniref:Adenylate cyclase, class 3 n=1 Tax=Ornithinimicrobium cerasi TaxID=2248773 RepID=A0A285VAV5_9MICO|nr:adenylate/guanylate cyclase domain-containing protein [Ornithinimicrobium cerasi]SOC51097.1 Adenylate cyclase, class 3 [Ornithinimicrobium cerasi]